MGSEDVYITGIDMIKFGKFLDRGADTGAYVVELVGRVGSHCPNVRFCAVGDVHKVIGL